MRSFHFTKRTEGSLPANDVRARAIFALEHRLAISPIDAKTFRRHGEAEDGVISDVIRVGVFVGVFTGCISMKGLVVGCLELCASLDSRMTTFGKRKAVIITSTSAVSLQSSRTYFTSTALTEILILVRLTAQPRTNAQGSN
jgi:NAD/NADP transhydrogenase beta subunit